MNNPLLEKFKATKAQFEADRQREDGWKIMEKIVAIINILGSEFNTLDGSQLSEIQVKLCGYKFYLADYLGELSRISEALKIELKNIKAKRWDEITEEIKSLEGKVKNKDQIENILMTETRALQDEQILYETLWYKYKLKVSAVDDILTAIVQRIAEKKREVEQSKM